MAQTIFQHWFVDFEFPDEEGNPYKSSGGEMVESELGLIPKGWEVGTISDMGKVIGGATPLKKNECFYSKNDIPWITPKDLSQNKNRYISHGSVDISEEGFNHSSIKMLPEGSILFTSRAPIGYIAIAKNKVTTNQGFKSIVPDIKQGFGSEFIYCWLKDNLRAIVNRASGSTFKEISGSEMKQIKAIVPDMRVLTSFRIKVFNFFRVIEVKETENAVLENIRDTLLPKLMSGEIRVPTEKTVG
ncbi:restriction endonuclease subunit S [Sporolactobacillus sp. CQH2019]|uniref:restriction endonuclease subunit S n=1 Tax=Sporolactobacillus sp. CQH2019 TaxID=3023512 RepID=UPI0023688BB0|nr:restriction endonuclease subunit S [Sporolactobacillus sp. CQH2019]MDD9149832.1 restriction endonuclease subunit S [Sporolactobacillus sp. CQH2019]